MTKKEVSFSVSGTGGRKELAGAIAVHGAKNAVLKGLAASLLWDGELCLDNVPRIEDVNQSLELLRAVGADVNQTEHQVSVRPKTLSSVLPVDIAKRMRASIVFAGPLLARTGRVVFPYPGGCVIGKRPIDLFIDGWRQMKAKVKEENGNYIVEAPNGLKGARIFFRQQSVTGTETIMLSAVLASGETIIDNAALEPEVTALGELLRQSGVKIAGLGTPTIAIQGQGLIKNRATYNVIPDRIEASSFILLAALSGRGVTITNCEPGHLRALISLLEESGVALNVREREIFVPEQKNPPRAIDVKTHEYPGFPTDLQAPLAVFLTQAVGQSFIFETIFENRLLYLETLNQMGAKTKLLDAHRALILGPTALSAREMVSPDLRAGLAYIIAAAVATGRSVIHNGHYIDRGYEAVETRLQALGLDIERL